MVPVDFHFCMIVTVTFDPLLLEYVNEPTGNGTFALFFTISSDPVQTAGAGVGVGPTGDAVEGSGPPHSTGNGQGGSNGKL